MWSATSRSPPPRSTSSTGLDPRHRDQLHLGLRHGPGRRGEFPRSAAARSRLVAVVDTGLDVNHPEFAGQIRRTVRHVVGRLRRDRLRGPRHVRDRPDRRARRRRPRRQGRGRQHQDPRRAGGRATPRGAWSSRTCSAASTSRSGAKARVVNLSLAGTSFSRSGRLRALEAAFFNDVLPVAAHGDARRRRKPARVPGRADRRAQGAGAASACPSGPRCRMARRPPSRRTTGL